MLRQLSHITSLSNLNNKNIVFFNSKNLDKKILNNFLPT